MTIQGKHPADAWRLSKRERQVVDLYIVHGLVKLVARDLGLSGKTVEIYLANAREKSGHRRLVPMVVAYDRASRTVEMKGDGT